MKAPAGARGKGGGVASPAGRGDHPATNAAGRAEDEGRPASPAEGEGAPDPHAGDATDGGSTPRQAG
eukprot:3280727-Pleurochrysis_carterae.AAC.1